MGTGTLVSFSPTNVIFTQLVRSFFVVVVVVVDMAVCSCVCVCVCVLFISFSIHHKHGPFSEERIDAPSRCSPFHLKLGTILGSMEESAYLTQSRFSLSLSLSTIDAQLPKQNKHVCLMDGVSIPSSKIKKILTHKILHQQAHAPMAPLLFN